MEINVKRRQSQLPEANKRCTKYDIKEIRVKNTPLDGATRPKSFTQKFRHKSITLFFTLLAPTLGFQTYHTVRRPYIRDIRATI